MKQNIVDKPEKSRKIKKKVRNGMEIQ